MKYDNLNAFEKHLTSSAPNHFSNLYLILGKDSFDVTSASNLLIRSLIPDEKKRELAVQLFDGASLDGHALLAEINAISFFSDKKILHVQNSEKLKKATQELLEPVIMKPSRSHYLIFSASGLLKTSSFYKKTEKAGIVLEFAELKPWEKEKRLIEWVGKLAAKERKMISYQACQLLVKTIGLDQGLLTQEMEKLICFIGERNEITPQDIGTICSNLQVNTVWELGEAIFYCETAKAVGMCRTILREGGGLLPLLRQLRYQFQTGYQTSTLLASGGSSSQAAQELPSLKGQMFDRHLERVQHYGKDRFKRGLLLLDDVELQTKNGQPDESLLADLLIVKLTE